MDLMAVEMGMVQRCQCQLALTAVLHLLGLGYDIAGGGQSGAGGHGTKQLIDQNGKKNNIADQIAVCTKQKSPFTPITVTVSPTISIATASYELDGLLRSTTDCVP